MLSNKLKKAFVALISILIVITGTVTCGAAQLNIDFTEDSKITVILPDDMLSATRNSKKTDKFFSVFQLDYETVMSNFKNNNIYMQAMDTRSKTTLTLSIEKVDYKNYNKLKDSQVEEIKNDFLKEESLTACTVDQANGVRWLVFSRNAVVNNSTLNTYQANTVYNGLNINILFQRNGDNVTNKDYETLKYIISSIEIDAKNSNNNYMLFAIFGFLGVLFFIILGFLLAKRDYQKNIKDTIDENNEDKKININIEDATSGDVNTEFNKSILIKDEEVVDVEDEDVKIYNKGKNNSYSENEVDEIVKERKDNKAEKDAITIDDFSADNIIYKKEDKVEKILNAEIQNLISISEKVEENDSVKTEENVDLKENKDEIVENIENTEIFSQKENENIDSFVDDLPQEDEIDKENDVENDIDMLELNSVQEVVEEEIILEAELVDDTFFKSKKKKKSRKINEDNFALEKISKTEEFETSSEEETQKTEEFETKSEEETPKIEEFETKSEEETPKIEEFETESEEETPKIEEFETESEEETPKIEEFETELEEETPKTEEFEISSEKETQKTEELETSTEEETQTTEELEINTEVEISKSEELETSSEEEIPVTEEISNGGYDLSNFGDGIEFYSNDEEKVDYIDRIAEKKRLANEEKIRKEAKKAQFYSSYDFFEEKPKKVQSTDLKNIVDYDVIAEEEEKIRKTEKNKNPKKSKSKKQKHTVLKVLLAIAGGLKYFFVHCGYFCINLSRLIRRKNAIRKRRKAEEKRREMARLKRQQMMRDKNGLVQVRKANSNNSRPNQNRNYTQSRNNAQNRNPYSQPPRKRK